jgi:hypothetical protein
MRPDSTAAAKEKAKFTFADLWPVGTEANVRGDMGTSKSDGEIEIIYQSLRQPSAALLQPALTKCEVNTGM